MKANCKCSFWTAHTTNLREWHFLQNYEFLLCKLNFKHRVTKGSKYKLWVSANSIWRSAKLLLSPQSAIPCLQHAILCLGNQHLKINWVYQGGTGERLENLKWFCFNLKRKLSFCFRFLRLLDSLRLCVQKTILTRELPYVPHSIYICKWCLLFNIRASLFNL